MFVHIFWLIGFRNRMVVLGEWAWAFVTFQRRVRLITGEKLLPDDGAEGRDGDEHGNRRRCRKILTAPEH